MIYANALSGPVSTAARPGAAAGTFASESTEIRTTTTKTKR